MAGIRERIEACGAQLLYLPPYSPDLNPIEKDWSKFKKFLRDAKARTKEALDQAVTDALKTITSDNAAEWFRHCGYGIQLSWFRSKTSGSDTAWFAEILSEKAGNRTPISSGSKRKFLKKGTRFRFDRYGVLLADAGYCVPNPHILIGRNSRLRQPLPASSRASAATQVQDGQPAITR